MCRTVSKVHYTSRFFTYTCSSQLHEHKQKLHAAYLKPVYVIEIKVAFLKGRLLSNQSEQSEKFFKSPNWLRKKPLLFWSCKQAINKLAEVAARTQPSRPRPRTLKKSEAKAKDRVSEDRLPRGQRQKGSRPRTRGHVWSYAQI